MTNIEALRAREPMESELQETTIATTTSLDIEPRPTAHFAFGDGRVIFDSETGSPLQFVHAAHPERVYLLADDTAWHSIEHAWGSGYLVADGFAARWNAPSALTVANDRTHSVHELGERARLDVERVAGPTYRESYRFTNVGDRPIEITGLAVQTPFADLYPGALDALTRRVHAHIFTGGEWSWVAAQPMDGSGPVLGLTLTEGALWGYSVETRNAGTISNARGHLVLHATDRARVPDAFGGQPVIKLAPGATYSLAWELAWYEDISAFTRQAPTPAEFSTYSATVGEMITVRTSQVVTADVGVTVTPSETDVLLTATTPGIYGVRIGGGSRTEVLFHDTVRDTVRKRARYVLDYQRSAERPGLLAHAILPVDTRTRLTQPTNGWNDWTDGSERIGVALMIQHALMRGWLDADADVALDGWADFARRYLIDDTAAPRRGSQQQHAGIRLYDSPWLSRFFLLRHRQHGRPADLELAASLLERGFELGLSRILTIGFSEVACAVSDALEHDGQLTRAAAIRQEVVSSARHFAARGSDLPGHEVAYEQAIVAPLLNLLIDAHRLTGDDEFQDAIGARLPWLLAFGGPQPHARLNGVAIRHWDGYWFGQRRQWGDVFPHYWSALTASVLLRLPQPLHTPHTDELAETILRANMVNYGVDGSATCAFVMPTSVDGVPAHFADPLANDQDFHLALWMQLEDDGVARLF
ncbi:hypothetical protein [Microbacterium sp. 1P06AB]|uniref:hypothetical protein n=1 Tax=Microbacterium sp. 1P06AB TaxID=3132289 RepID=UPI0039A556FB